MELASINPESTEEGNGKRCVSGLVDKMTGNGWKVMTSSGWIENGRRQAEKPK